MQASTKHLSLSWLCLPVLLVGLAMPATRVQEAQPLRILVTNDDGIDSPGLTTLVRELAGLGEVVVCAPDSNRSGSSHSTTFLSEPQTVTRVTVEGASQAFAISGTPSDAVTYAVFALAGERGFDFVVAGINRGANVGDVAHYSGTVGAAMEGAYHGIPSLAVSQNHRAPSYELAARFTTRFVRAWSERQPASDVVWSINVPADAAEKISGVAPAHMDGAYLHPSGIRRVSGDDDSRVVQATTGRGRAGDAGSDTAAYLAGEITLTPLRFDWTDSQALQAVAGWGLTVGD